MYARAVEEADARLRELRWTEREDLGVAALTLLLALVATQVRPSLAMPLFLGAVVLGVLGVRAVWGRWDLVDRLAGERDAYVIPEVLAYAARETTMERRRSLAAVIRNALPTCCDESTTALAEELELLAGELENDELALDPACAVSCRRLVTDPTESPLLNEALAPDDLRSRVRLIRDGFTHRRLAA